jgi:DNA-binding IclR family transcriptional regulator
VTNGKLGTRVARSGDDPDSMPRTGQPSVRHVAAVERALAVLDVLSDGSAELGTNEISRRTGINASTVSRLLATLAAAGIVEHVEATGRYRLGLRLLQLGNTVLARLDLREIARPHLRALVEETGETATLSAPGDVDAVTVDFVQSSSTVQSVARVGRPSVGHATATGKIMLAFGDAQLPRGTLAAYTERTVTDRRALGAELERIRLQGHADAVGEREPHLNAIAAPVFGARGELVAIMGVQGPASRFGREPMRKALASLLPHAEAVSRSLGWERDEDDAD